MILDDIKDIIEMSWSYETCSPFLKEYYSDSNSSLGQCAVTALIINDYMGGKIMRCMASSGSHYYNIINNQIIDLTVDQFNGEKPLYEERTREYLLSNKDTKDRYIKLLKNVKSNFMKYGSKEYNIINSQGMSVKSKIPGTLGGHKKLKIYGQLDCKSALKWIEKGYYVDQRVFFLNESDAKKAGYRPCSVCMNDKYQVWKKLVRK